MTFRAALITLTQPLGESEKPQKLVVTIDELDRCRPDYALSVLEVIKHFFQAPNVYFVLGVNLEELENSVRARYGEKTNAALYLQKFVSLNLRLSETISINRENQPAVVAYFDVVSKSMDLDKTMIKDIRALLSG